MPALDLDLHFEEKGPASQQERFSSAAPLSALYRRNLTDSVHHEMTKLVTLNLRLQRRRAFVVSLGRQLNGALRGLEIGVILRGIRPDLWQASVKSGIAFVHETVASALQNLLDENLTRTIKSKNGKFRGRREGRAR